MIIPWWVGSIAGVVLATSLNIFFKEHPITFKYIILYSPLMIITSLCFWYGFRYSISYILTIILLLAIPAILNFAIGITYFKEVIETKEAIGIILILLGLCLNSFK